jgi:hypothetical protein
VDRTGLPQDSPGEELVGVISWLARKRSAEPSVEIWVSLKNAGGTLRANSAAKVTLATSRAENVIVYL